jgi:hypothetical protein
MTKQPEIKPILPKTDGWDAEAKEHPRIRWLHRLFIAIAIFFAAVSKNCFWCGFNS